MTEGEARRLGGHLNTLYPQWSVQVLAWTTSIRYIGSAEWVVECIAPNQEGTPRQLTISDPNAEIERICREYWEAL